MKHRVTIKDIARELSISPSTVSRALKGNPEISQETRRKVQELAEKLEYEPNVQALGLRHQRTYTIGIIIPEISHYFFSEIINGVEKEAHERGYNVIISQTNENYEREISNAKMLYNHRVDGLLVSVSKGDADYDHFHALQDKGLPIVFFDRAPAGFDASTVTIDDEEGGYIATTHLLNQGKSRILHLAGPRNLKITQDRMKGYEKALKERGLDIPLPAIMNCDDEHTAKTKILSLLEKGLEFDGVFATNDLAALGAMKALKKKNIAIPQDVGIVGFSNWMFADQVEPSITSISQPGTEIGREAAKLLLREIEVDQNQFIEPKSVVLPIQLIHRGSS